MSGDVKRPNATKDASKPWRDYDLMYHLYKVEKKSQNDIAEQFECGQATIGFWLREKHEIETRSIKEGHRAKNPYNCTLITHPRGYERFRGTDGSFYHHRLFAYSMWGPETVYDNHVHHRNNITWDNRKENMDTKSPGDHSKHHRRPRLSITQRAEVAQKYEQNDESSSRSLAKEYGVSAGMILRIVEEFSQVSLSDIRTSGGQIEAADVFDDPFVDQHTYCGICARLNSEGVFRFIPADTDIVEYLELDHAISLCADCSSKVVDLLEDPAATQGHATEQENP